MKIPISIWLLLIVLFIGSVYCVSRLFGAAHAVVEPQPAAAEPTPPPPTPDDAGELEQLLTPQPARLQPARFDYCKRRAYKDKPECRGHTRQVRKRSYYIAGC